MNKSELIGKSFFNRDEAGNITGISKILKFDESVNCLRYDTIELRHWKITRKGKSWPQLDSFNVNGLIPSEDSYDKIDSCLSMLISGCKGILESSMKPAPDLTNWKESSCFFLGDCLWAYIDGQYPYRIRINQNGYDQNLDYMPTPNSNCFWYDLKVFEKIRSLFAQTLAVVEAIEQKYADRDFEMEMMKEDDERALPF